MLFSSAKAKMIDERSALTGRSERPFSVPARHFVLDAPLEPPFPVGIETVAFGMGCFWGAERKYWERGDVFTTAVGYSAGFTPNPTYQEVCSAKTGHNEVVLVAFDPATVSFASLLQTFWENHNPTQGMRQGNDIGTQYRSGIYCTSDAQRAAALASAEMFGPRLAAAGYGAITTEILAAREFYYAEDYHQQYLAKNPGGYCGIGGTGISCPIGIEPTGSANE